MEKVLNSDNLSYKKFKSIMKITLFFLIIGILHISAETYAQKTHISIDVKAGTFYDVVTQIEGQTEFMFFYKSEDIDNNKEVNIYVKNKQVTDVLDALLKDTDLTYRIIDKHITVLKKNAIVQQRKTITGTVLDQDNMPVIGANIVMTGTTTGTITDINGKFTLEVPQNATLTVSYIGYTEQSVVVGNRTTLVIRLVEDTKTLDEVVVVGYGTMLKRNISTSVSSVSGDALQERPTASNIFQGMQGKVAGVSIMLNSGAPGGSPVIKIRGTGSINSDTAPLYVVDGVVGVDPETIDPNIIKSIDILKDATSSAIYGSRGANGVVVITTKEGRKNITNISYNTVLSVGTLARKVDVLDAYESLEVFKRAYEYAPGRIAPHLNPDNNFARKADLFNADGTPKYNTDWQDEVTRNSFSHQHSLSFSGGNDKLTAVANVSYRDNQGIMLETYRKQLTGFLNLSWDLKDWFRLQAVMNMGNTKTRESENAISRYTLEFLPFMPVQYEDGSYSRKGDYPGAEDAENPVKILKERERIVERQYMLANLIGTFKISDKLTLTTSFSRQDANRMVSLYLPSTLFGYGDSYNGRAEREHHVNSSWTNEDYLTYDNTWGIHNLNVVAGASWYYEKYTKTDARVDNFFDDFFQYNNLEVGTSRSRTSSDYYDSKMNSYYARANYNYDERYLIGASFRYDGSSRFGENNRYGFFPSFSAAWRISNEAFFESIKETIEDLKLRASYGIVGNAGISNYRTMASYANSTVPFNKSLESAVRLDRISNPDLKWEKSNQLNVGLDLSLFKGRIEFLADFYNKITTDLLYNLQIPSTTGYSNSWTNLGKIRNRGIELALTTRNIQSRDLLWTSTLNYTMNRSKVIDIDGNIIGKWGGRIVEGRPLNQLYGYVRLGTWGTDEAEEAAKYNKKPGDLKYWDKNGNGIKDGEDQDYIGLGTPKFEMNMNNSISYKGFTFMFDLHWAYGNKLINFTRQLMENRVTFSNAYGGILEKAWRPDNQGGMIVSLRLPGDGYENDVDSYSCEPGSFLRVRNIGLKYDFSSQLLAKAHIKSLSLGFNVENALLFTNYTGSDPEVTSYDAVFEQGIDFYTYPKPRTFAFTLGVNF
ncbi:MAG: TonB-dependent receptor [Tannerellaceae bacterium]|jgi:TonB-linked SusC/RagA family outer membrane protein|nr:TonB-dependent receptor [Tannerellaceae bacterium]